MAVYEPKGVSFNKLQTEYQLFPEEYFSSSDCYVYFNDLWVDDLTGLSFKLRETTYGIHGYASNTWDHVSRGKRFVEGQFRIAFREAGYLFALLDHIGQIRSQGLGGSAPALGWLLNKENTNGIPKWHAGVLERIEDLLKRKHGDPNVKEPDTTKTVDRTLQFNWPIPLAMDQNSRDDLPQNQMPDERPLGKTYKTAIKQLQQRLIDLGFGFQKSTAIKEITRSCGAGPKAIAAANPPSNWILVQRFKQGSGGTAPAYDSSSAGSCEAEKILQQRLNQYPTLMNEFMGSGDTHHDGKFGPLTKNGLTKFLQFAGLYYTNAEGKQRSGAFVDPAIIDALSLGLEVNGIYDLPTKVAVYLFQEKHGLSPTGKVDDKTKELMAEKTTEQVTVPGKSAYSPENLAEPRYAMYEKEIWARPFIERAEEVRSQDFFFYRGRNMKDAEGKVTGGKYTDILHQQGIDIYINYGPLPQYVQSKLNQITDTVSFNTTVRAIRNVQITDFEQIIDANTGQPIEEIYTFIARDLD